jgi:hypothetical protein
LQKRFRTAGQQKITADSRREYLQHDAKEWKREYFNRENGGYLVVDRGRIEHSKVSKNERAKFDKEYAMAKVFAENGYKIEMLKEVPGVSSPDVTINGVKAELKRVSSHNNIVKYAQKAVKKQGAEVVLFEFEKETEAIKTELIGLKREGISAYYYYSSNKGSIYVL